MSGRGKVLGASMSQPLEPALLGAAIPDPSSPDFHKIVEALPAAVYVTDEDGNITYYNEAAAKLWGHRPPLGDSKWCGSWRLYWPDGTPMAHDECPMAQAVKQGRPITGVEAIAERPDGSRVTFRPYPTPLFDEAGDVVGAVNILIDVSDRRQIEHLNDQAARCRRLAHSVTDRQTLETLSLMAEEYEEKAKSLTALN